MKRNWKSMIVLVMALSMCATLAGCGDTEETSSTENSSTNPVAAENNVDDGENVPDIDTAEDNNENAAEVETVEDNGETQENEISDKYAFYEDLAAEWDKMPKIHSLDPRGWAAVFETDDGKICVLGNVSYRQPSIALSYDPAKKEAKVITNEVDSAWYSNGYIYCRSISRTNQFNISKFDTDGSLIAESVNLTFDNSSGIAITDSGEIFYVYHDTAKGQYMPKRLSADLQTITDLTPPQTEGAHGIGEDVKIGGFIGVYNNKLLAYNEEREEGKVYVPAIWAWDLNTNEWELICEDFADMSKINMITTTLVGKYLLTGQYIVDLETGEVVAVVDEDNFKEGYSGGTYSTIHEEGKYYRGRYANGGGIEKGADMPDIDADNGSVYSVSDTQYVYVDDYGIFLRTYEDGADGEETIYLFEN